MPMFTEIPVPENTVTEWIVHQVMHAAAATVKNTGSTYAGWRYDLGRRLSGKRCPFKPHLENRTGLQEGAACLE